MPTRRRRHHRVDPLSVVIRFVDAANRHDAGAVADCVHRDFESLQPIHPVRNFKGSAQLLTNWRAIFRTEPGFRLTMLRSAVDGDTVWVELHGAGQHAEVAGIFIIGVEDGLMRWARVYSELVEPHPQPAVSEPLEATTDATAPNGDRPIFRAAGGHGVSLSEAEQAESRLSADESAALGRGPQAGTDLEVEPAGDAPPAAGEVEIQAALEEQAEPAAELEPEAAEAEPEAAEAEPEAAEAEPEAAEPETEVAEPEPEAAEPEPAAAELEPEAAEPEPEAAEPEPAAAEPDTDATATTAVPEPVPAVDPGEGAGSRGGWRRWRSRSRRGLD